MATSADRQRNLRKRRKERGEEELRGLWAPKSMHSEIKKMIRDKIKQERDIVARDIER